MSTKLRFAAPLLFIVAIGLVIAITNLAAQSPASADSGASTFAITTPPPDGTPGQFGGGGFSNQPNGLISQSAFNADTATFEEVDRVPDGLGPIYNAQSCSECHQNPVTGAISQITEERAGHIDAAGNFIAPSIAVFDENGTQFTVSGRTLINSRAVCAEQQELLPTTETIRAFRTSLNTLGDGFVEMVLDQTLINLLTTERTESGGVVTPKTVRVGTLENFNNPNVPHVKRVGRFGWKGTISSLLTFSSDAYLNEIGITNRFPPFNREAVPVPPGQTNSCDTVNDPEDAPNKQPGAQDIDIFAEFMRATQAPPRNPLTVGTPDVVSGENIFTNIGCAVCHRGSLQTAPTGTVIAALGTDGSGFTVPSALGGQTIHPFGDFLLHNINTSDGIVDTGDLNDAVFTDGTSISQIANFMRTAPLWGVRTRNRLMHDGESLTFNDAIQRHAGEAATSRTNFNNLLPADQEKVIKFLKSL
jgi:CxxC motif-containing protein (DUF1111 family)